MNLTDSGIIQQDNTADKTRDVSFDAFRGLAIITVIAIHAVRYSITEGYSQTVGWKFYFIIVYLQLLLFAVPALFFMSGYWSSKKSIEYLNDYGFFLKKKLSRILVPYLFWSLVLLGYTSILTQKIDVNRILTALLTGQASYPYYFIIALIQLYLMTPLLHYINRKKYGLLLVLLFALASLFAVYLSRVYGVIFHLPIYLPFYSWLIYYEIGLLAGNRRNKMILSSNLWFFVLPAIIISLLMSEIEAAVLASKFDKPFYAISPVKFSTLSYSVCIIVAFLLLREHIRNWSKFLVLCGNYSFGIYLIHLPVLDSVAGLVRKCGIIYAIQPLYQVIITLLTLSLCIIIIAVTRRLLPEFFCRTVLGF